MSLSPSVLFLGGQLGTSLGTLVTGKTNAKTLITKAMFTNTDTDARLLTVNLVRSGGAASSANILINAVPIAAGESYEATELEQQILDAGDTIQAKADAVTALNCTGISGYVIA